ncbi:UTP--glucose-1-phosphate uridylyltransferase GalU [Paenibacillus thermoaerophilus]|uniref:UTP--glucose-1-phosphate uridylyltransferase n=1 Tax=Paenibacillus thermoaerophilus TaxID=1215385 RepID=A0ABW2UY09_9BACL|nr:UTP--glucose-1-phosphate uridylyltransferase GalU [Paenibacillus thermoaerophilus]TMV19139.1 UTP--glucose-1-phosphate uridylyltransferase GalU [Paenibacillus thermoaerophilus]
MTRIRKAIIPAAGLGTRFLPATKAQPKEMLPIVDKPAIQYIIEEAVESGIEDIMIVTGRNKRAIEDHFDKSFELEAMLEASGKQDLLREVQAISNLADVHYIRQKQPLGLGHAVLCARKFVGDEPFAVLLGDDIIQSQPHCLRQMMDVYERHRTSVIAAMEVPRTEVDRYGIIAPDGEAEGPRNHYISDLVEKPDVDSAPSRLAVIGRYIIEPDIFDILESIEPGRGGEIQLTDALRVLNARKPMIAHTLDGKRYDIGDKFGYIEATIEMALQRKELADQLREYLRGLAVQKVL